MNNFELTNLIVFFFLAFILPHLKTRLTWAFENRQQILVEKFSDEKDEEEWNNTNYNINKRSENRSKYENSAENNRIRQQQLASLAFLRPFAIVNFATFLRRRCIVRRHCHRTDFVIFHTETFAVAAKAVGTPPPVRCWHSRVCLTRDTKSFFLPRSHASRRRHCRLPHSPRRIFRPWSQMCQISVFFVFVHVDAELVDTRQLRSFHKVLANASIPTRNNLHKQKHKEKHTDVDIVCKNQEKILFAKILFEKIKRRIMFSKILFAKIKRRILFAKILFAKIKRRILFAKILFAKIKRRIHCLRNKGKKAKWREEVKSTDVNQKHWWQNQEKK